MTRKEAGSNHRYTARAVYEKMEEYERTGTGYVLCILIRKEGSAPREAGVMMAVTASEAAGTVGGGAAEAAAMKAARGMLADRPCGFRLMEVDMSGHIRENGQEAELICGGNITLLLVGNDSMQDRLAQRICGTADRVYLYMDMNGEDPCLALRGEAEMPHGIAPADGSLYFEEGVLAVPASQPKRAFLFGAGHIAACLCPLLDSIGFRVTVADDRPELLSAERFPDAERVIACSYEELGDQLDTGEADYAVVATRGHEKDFEALSYLLPRRPYYIACIGSLRKADKVRRRLIEAGFTEAEADRVHSPAGLPIGGRSPAEIAVSIAAQMIMTRYGRTEAMLLPAKQADVEN